jgi:perosamine synthetase
MKIRNFKELAYNGGKPLIGLQKLFCNSISSREKKAALKVIDSGELSGFSASANKEFFGGKEVLKLERSFKKKFNTKFAVAFNSATSAIYASIMSLKLDPGAEIITTPYTMHATVASILQANCIPVFADINNDDFNLDPESVKKKITKKTKAIIVVNLFGQAGRLLELKKIAKKNSIYLIEDNSQSPGSLTPNGFSGTVGDLGIFSFNRHKTIQSGEGGVLITNSKNLYFNACLSRNHGESVVREWKIKDIKNTIGQNLRMTEIIAAIANVQFSRLNELNKIRIKRANWFKKILSKYDFLEFPKVKKKYTNVYYILPIIYKKNILRINRDKFCKIVSSEGITFRPGYRIPLYDEPFYKKKICFGSKNWPYSCNKNYKKAKIDKKNFPNTEKAQKEIILIQHLGKNISFNQIKKLEQILDEIIKYKKKL